MLDADVDAKMASREDLTALDAFKTEATRTTDGTQEAHTVPAAVVDTLKIDHAEDPTVSVQFAEVKTNASTSRTAAQANAEERIAASRTNRKTLSETAAMFRTIADYTSKTDADASNNNADASNNNADASNSNNADAITNMIVDATAKATTSVDVTMTTTTTVAADATTNSILISDAKNNKIVDVVDSKITSTSDAVSNQSTTADVVRKNANADVSRRAMSATTATNQLSAVDAKRSVMSATNANNQPSGANAKRNVDTATKPRTNAAADTDTYSF
jgi:hypothetical protein